MIIKMRHFQAKKNHASAFIIIIIIIFFFWGGGLWNDVQLQPKLLDRLDFCRAVF